jgi:hypothetical protein
MLCIMAYSLNCPSTLAFPPQGGEAAQPSVVAQLAKHRLNRGKALGDHPLALIAVDALAHVGQYVGRVRGALAQQGGDMSRLGLVRCAQALVAPLAGHAVLPGAPSVNGIPIFPNGGLLDDHLQAARPRSAVEFRRLDVLALFKLCEPVIGLCRCGVQPCALIVFPSLDAVLPISLALFLAHHALRYGFAHQPARGALAGLSQVFESLCGVLVDLDHDRANMGG